MLPHFLSLLISLPLACTAVAISSDIHSDYRCFSMPCHINIGQAKTCIGKNTYAAKACIFASQNISLHIHNYFSRTRKGIIMYDWYKDLFSLRRYLKLPSYIFSSYYITTPQYDDMMTMLIDADDFRCLFYYYFSIACVSYSQQFPLLISAASPHYGQLCRLVRVTPPQSSPGGHRWLRKLGAIFQSQLYKLPFYCSKRFQYGWHILELFSSLLDSSQALYLHFLADAYWWVRPSIVSEWDMPFSKYWGIYYISAHIAIAYAFSPCPCLSPWLELLNCSFVRNEQNWRNEASRSASEGSRHLQHPPTILHLLLICPPTTILES